MNVLTSRLARASYGIFTNKKLPPLEAANEALKSTDLASKIEENAGNKIYLFNKLLFL
jgi:hypothetical protein